MNRRLLLLLPPLAVALGAAVFATHDSNKPNAAAEHGTKQHGFTGNEYNPNAVLRPPMRYIAEGSSAEITSLIRAAQADKWLISKTATASDGAIIVQFQSGASMTNGQSEKLLKRIWQKEFGDIAFGMAPRKLSAANELD
jgi:hypothetical protein